MEVASGLGVKLSQVYDWRRKYEDSAAAARQERGESPEEEEVKRLRREVAELRKDKEMQKKPPRIDAQGRRPMNEYAFIDAESAQTSVAK